MHVDIILDRNYHHIRVRNVEKARADNTKKNSHLRLVYVRKLTLFMGLFHTKQARLVVMETPTHHGLNAQFGEHF